MSHAWKTDNYKFVGKAFDNAYANRINTLAPIMGQKTTNSSDYQLTGAGGFGELKKYDGENINKGSMHRGFNTIITPEEFALSIPVGFKEAKVDKMGECRKVGTRLGDSAAMTVYMHILRCFGGAFDPSRVGGDGVSWANDKHPVASKGSVGRKFIVDEEAGYYSNIAHDAMSVAAITSLQSRANRLVTPDGLPFLCELDTLLVSPEKEADAKKLCGDDARLDPETAAHGANPVRGLKYIVIGGGNLGFTKKQWGMCDRRLMKELFQLIYITRPQVFNSELDNPLIDMYTGYTDFGVGWGDARQIFFSDPA